MARGRWLFDICDGSGSKLSSLTRAQGATVTYTRNGVPEVSLSLSHDDAECAVVLSALAAGTGGGMPTLKGYRNSVLRFNGYLAAVSEESGVDASTATFTFQGPFGRLLGDGSSTGSFIVTVNSGDPIVYGPEDAGSIALTLAINASDEWREGTGANRYGGPWVSTASGTLPPYEYLNRSIELSKVRQRTYQAGQNAGQAIIDLTNVLDGFDFEITPVETAHLAGTLNAALLGTLHIYARQGGDRPGAKFEYGPGTLANCAAAHRQTTPPINFVYTIGANGLFGLAIDEQSVATYGVWESLSTFSDVSEQQTLDDKAQALLRPNPIKVLDFTPDPGVASCPHPFDDYWIGDTVYFYANRGALVEGPSPVRVNQITLAIDPETGLESDTIPNPESPDEERVLRASLQAEVVLS